MKTSMILAMTLSILAGSIVLIGCSDSTSPESGGTGRMVINLMDAPGDYDQVNVEIIRVEVHRADSSDSGSGWMILAEDTTRVDLLTLSNGNSMVLADSTLPAGKYTQVRLILSDNNSVMVDSVEYDLEVPSSSNSGLKLNHPFDIADGALYEVTLDFDADRSVHQTGNGQYKMKPVIRIIVNQTSGGVQGIVEPVAARARVWTVSGPDTVVAWADTTTGTYLFSMLASGTYDFNFEATAGAYRDTALQGVQVTAEMVKDLGNMVLESE